MQSSTMQSKPARLDERSTKQERLKGLNRVVPLAITLLAGIVCYGIFINRGLWLSVIGYSLAPAERVLNGEVPYRDFLYNYTPGLLWLNALLMKLFGATVMTARAGLFAFKLGTLVAVFYIGQRLTSPLVALIPVALTLFWLGHNYIYAIVPTQYSMLFILCGLIFMLNYDESEKMRWILFGGMAAGVVFVFKYNVGIFLLGSGTLAIAIREAMIAGESAFRPRLISVVIKRAAIYWIGFAILAGAMVLYLAFNNALGAMVDHFLHHALAYGEEKSVPLPSIKLVAAFALASLVIIAGGFIVLTKAPKLFMLYAGLTVCAGAVAVLIPGRLYRIKASASAAVAYFPIFLFFLAVIIAFFQLKRIYRNDALRRDWWRLHGAIVFTALFAIGAYLELYPRADYYHLVRVLPLVFLLATLFAARLLPALLAYFQMRLPLSKRATLLCAAAPLVFFFATGIKDTWQPHFDSSLHFIERTGLQINSARGILVRRRQAELIEGLASLIESNSSTDDYIFSFAKRGTAFYFLTGRSNPTRFVWWHSVGLKGGDREAVLEQIEGRQFKLILMEDKLKDRNVRDLVSAGYDQIGKTADIAVYKRREK